MPSWEKRIIVGLTGRNAKQVITKMRDAQKLGITEAGLFLEVLHPSARRKVYDELLKTKIKSFPLVHIRNDMQKWELDFLEKLLHPKYYTIHESTFKYLAKWKGYMKKLYLELDYNDKIAGNVHVERIGGYCIDLSHYMAACERHSKESVYIKHHHLKRYFKCNHLNGYTYKRKKDIHGVRNAMELDYLKSIPKGIFSNCIAMEMWNPVKEQLAFKKHVIKLLS